MSPSRTDDDVEIMIDCESLAVTADPVILSIGLAYFSQTRGVIDVITIRVDAASGVFAGLKVDHGHPKSTARWWGDQTQEARDAVTTGPSVTLREAIEDLRRLISPSHRVWAHGAATDLLWIASACVALGVELPWYYRAPRDTRTLFDLAERFGWEPPSKTAGPTAHVAGEDARRQAEDVISARSHLCRLIG